MIQKHIGHILTAAATGLLVGGYAFAMKRTTLTQSAAFGGLTAAASLTLLASVFGEDHPSHDSVKLAERAEET